MASQALFIYPIHHDRVVYYRKRLQFYQAASRVAVTDLLIVYDSRALPNFDPTPMRAWAPHVHFLDYHHLVRRRVDFSRPAFLDPCFAELRAWVKERPRFDHIFAYEFHVAPLVKMLAELLAEHLPDALFVRVEDGLFDYLADRDPARFDHADGYRDSPFTDTPYRHYFSTEHPHIDRDRYAYALFHPELIQHKAVRATHVNAFFDFQKALSPQTLFEQAVLMSPNLRWEIACFTDFAKHRRPHPPHGWWAALHPFSFWFEETQLQPIWPLAQAARHIVISPPGADADHLRDLLTGNGFSGTITITTNQNAPADAAPTCHFHLGPPDSAATNAVALTPRDLRYFEPTTAAQTTSRQRFTMMGGEPMSAFAQLDPVVPFSSLTPFEFNRMDGCLVLTAGSSIGYRLRHIQPNNESLVILPNVDTVHPRWQGERRVTRAEWDLWAELFQAMGCPVFRGHPEGVA